MGKRRNSSTPTTARFIVEPETPKIAVRTKFGSDSQEEQSVYLLFRSKSLFDQPMSWTRVKDVY